TKDLLAAGAIAEAAEVAAAGLDLWRGPAFGDLADFAFAQSEALRLEAMRLETIEDLLEAELALGQHHHVVAELEMFVEEHPLRERSRGQLMLALHRCGRQADALGVYRAGRRQLIDELGLEPGKELQNLQQSILRDDPGLRVEPVELRMRRHLPAPATPLIGRRDEIDEVSAMLRDPSVRLVTATGPGGIGKTRLALQVAHELADAFVDGVFFVGLAELRDPDLVLPTLAATIGVEEVPDQPLAATLETHLTNRQLLLLVDNFEHVDEAAPLLGSLLKAAPGLKILVTSRSPLRIYGDHEYQVPQLALREEAVPLFAQRAHAADATFRLTERVAEEVCELCARLDCLPLAIELAAARVTEFTPKQMLSELPRRLELAVLGPRDQAARQQTLRAAIDWSLRLLPSAEQRTFTKLAVFVGGWATEAADAVCGGSSTQLTSLASKSLIKRHRPEPDRTRFDMLETIREYGLERFDHGPSPSKNAVRDEHARYFLALAEAAADELRGPDRMHWITRLEEERDNMRAALTYLLDKPIQEQPQTAETALRLAAALRFFWYKTGGATEGSAWLERTLAAAPAAPDVLRARALHSLGILAADRGDDVHALALCEESCELFRRAGEMAWVARSLNSQGGIARDMGDLARAERDLSESADIRRTLGDDRASLAIVLGNLALVALDRRDVARARDLGEECLEMTAKPDQWSPLQVLADVAVEEGDVDRAGELLRLALPLLRPLGAYRLVEYLETCAGLAAAMGKGETAGRITGAIDAALDEMAAQNVPADARMRERRLAPARESLGDERLEALQSEGRALTLERALDEVLGGILADSEAEY
ncbi:MAG: tetratricopeptide repeat protein, partial [Nocardioidaceae bacterium]|nr:tetratricopeptide repeat protein [Nocardioidaceae bacterium]